MTNLTVLHVLGPLRASGMERMLVSGARYFRTEGVSTIVYGHAKGSTYAEEMRRANLDVILGDPIYSSRLAARKFRQLVRDRHVDVVHIHTEGHYLRSAFEARRALRGGRGVVVRTVHSVFLARGRWWISRQVQARVGDRFTDAVVAPSSDVARNEDSYGRNCQTIWNWVDDRFTAIAADRADAESVKARAHVSGRRTALLVGNCSAVKRHELALHAIADSDLDVIHIGDESGASAGENALLENLQLLGRLLDRGMKAPDAALREADVYLMPSRNEGMSIALAEAIVAGVPAIVSDSPGLRWAASLPKVRLVADSSAAWREALKRPVNAEQAATPPCDARLDFSAKRGVCEYVSLYRRLTARHGWAGS